MNYVASGYVKTGYVRQDSDTVGDYTFDKYGKFIYISPLATTCDLANMWSRWADWMIIGDNAKIKPAIKYSGFDPTPSGFTGATLTIDMSKGNYFSAEANNNFTLEFSNAPTTTDEVVRGIIRITQDGTGSRVLTLGSNVISAKGVSFRSDQLYDCYDNYMFPMIVLTDGRIFFTTASRWLDWSIEKHNPEYPTISRERDRIEKVDDYTYYNIDLDELTPY